jgi:hypothetical protein
MRHYPLVRGVDGEQGSGVGLEIPDWEGQPMIRFMFGFLVFVAFVLQVERIGAVPTLLFAAAAVVVLVGLGELASTYRIRHGHAARARASRTAS